MLQEIARARLETHLSEAAKLLPLAMQTPAEHAKARPLLNEREQNASLAALLLQMAEGGVRRGTDEYGVALATAGLLGREVDPHRVTWPWGALARRDLTATSEPELTGTTTATAADALRPWSVALQAGATVFPNLTGNLSVPLVSGDVAGTWLAFDGGSAVTPSDPTLSSRTLSPKGWSGIVKFSHQFLRASAQAEGFVRQQLLRVAGRALDAAILNGSGANGAPLGLVNISQLASSGASLDWGDVLAIREAIAAAGASDANVTWVAATDVRQTLGARPRDATLGSGFIWQDDRIDGRAAYVTPDAPEATLVCGDFAQVAVGLWGPGISIQLNPFSDFKSGIISARVLLDVDVVALQIGALAVRTGVN